MEVEARDNVGITPLARTIIHNYYDAAELLIDKGAKVSNVDHPRFPIPNWIHGLVAKRGNVKRSLYAFIGVLRKRFEVCGSGTEYTRGRIPRDVVDLLGRWVWITRFDGKWAIPDESKLIL